MSRTVLGWCLAVVMMGSSARLQAHEAPADGSVSTTGSPGPWSQTILRLEAMPCTGSVRSVPWTAPAALSIRSALVWIGTTYRPADVIDTWATLSLRNGFVLAFLGLDHYAPFTGLHQLEKEWRPPLTVNAGQVVSFAHVCASYAGPAESAAFVIVNWTTP